MGCVALALDTYLRRSVLNREVVTTQTLPLNPEFGHSDCMAYRVGASSRHRQHRPIVRGVIANLVLTDPNDLAHTTLFSSKLRKPE